MGEILKENWFVVLIAVIIVSFVGYFVYDSNKYNVSSKSSDGKEVLASIDGTDVTAESVYKELNTNDDDLLFNFYRNAIINEYIETTSDIKSDAKTMQENIEESAESSSSTDYKVSIANELGSYGYSSYDELYDYCVTYCKEKEMDTKYMEKHFDELKEAVEAKNPRTISIIKIAIADPNNITEDEQKTLDDVDKEIEEESFAKAATAFSEDTNTASDKGYYGYVDTDTTDDNYDSTVLQGSMSLKKGETSDWISVTDGTSGLSYYFKVHVNETDLTKIYDKGSDTVKESVLSAMLNDNTNLEYTILDAAAKKVDISFGSDKYKERIESYEESLKEANLDE